MNELEVKKSVKSKKIKSSFKFTDEKGNLVRYVNEDFLKQKKIQEQVMTKVKPYIENLLKEGELQYEIEHFSYYGLRNLYESSIAKLEQVPKEWLSQVIRNLIWTNHFNTSPDFMQREIDKELDKFWSDRQSPKRFLPTPKNTTKSLIDKTFQVFYKGVNTIRYASQPFLFNIDIKIDISPACDTLFDWELKQNIKLGVLKVEEESDFYGFVNIPTNLFSILEKQTGETIVRIKDECRRLRYLNYAKGVNWVTLYQAIKNILGIHDSELEEFYSDSNFIENTTSRMVRGQSMLLDKEDYF